MKCPLYGKKISRFARNDKKIAVCRVGMKCPPLRKKRFLASLEMTRKKMLEMTRKTEHR